MRRLGVTVFSLAAFALGLQVTALAKELPEAVELPLPTYQEMQRSPDKPGFVEVFFVITSKGEMQDIKILSATDSQLREAVQLKIPQWRFKREASKGRQIKAMCGMRIEFSKGTAKAGPVKDYLKYLTQPKVLKQGKPEYPQELAKAKASGQVTIQFTVTETGTVDEPKVMVATHPAFERPAIAAVLKWEFRPAQVKGVPISLHVMVPIRFTLDDYVDADAYSVTKPKEEAPKELRLDVSPRPKATVFAVYPFEQAVANKGGEAEVQFVIDPTGYVSQSKLISASEPEFGQALIAAVEAWQFVPGKRAGKPVVSVLQWKQSFVLGGRESAIDDTTAVLLDEIRKGTFAPAKAEDLDAGMKPTFVVEAVFPRSLERMRVEGAAVIEVIVDKKGRAVLPKILNASAPEFGWAAATAAQRWLFDPPTVRGRPVEVLATIPFKFVVPKLPGAPSARN